MSWREPAAGGKRPAAAPPIFHLHIRLSLFRDHLEQFHVVRAELANNAATSAPMKTCVSLPRASRAFAHFCPARNRQTVGRISSSSNFALTAHYEALKVGGRSGQTAVPSASHRRFERFNCAISAPQILPGRRAGRQEPQRHQRQFTQI